MQRFIGTTLVMMIIGIAIGVYLGWEQFPVEVQNNSMCQLSELDKENYTLMVARGFRADDDPNAALDRLLPLRAINADSCLRDETLTQIDNIPAWVQEVTDRYRTRGADLDDICDVASLSFAFGRPVPGYVDGSPSSVCSSSPAS